MDKKKHIKIYKLELSTTRLISLLEMAINTSLLNAYLK